MVGGRPRQGRIIRELRALILERFQASDVVLCDSGTHALQLAIGLAARAHARKSVALPAYTCYDLVSAALGAAVEPMFYDINPDSLQPDAASLNACLERHPAAIVVVHQFGRPLPMELINARVEGTGTLLIEDAAQGHGGSIGSRPLGSLAPLSVVSFGRGKGWTGGRGGALLLRDSGMELLDPESVGALSPASRATSLSMQLLAQWLFGRPALYGIATAVPGLGLGETHFVPPTNPAAMPPYAAAVLLATFALAEKEAATRRRNAAALRKRLSSVNGLWVLPEPESGAVAGYLRLPLRFPGRRAADLLHREARRLGILPSYPLALPRLPQTPVRTEMRLPTPGAETLARELFTAPVHHWLGEREMDAVVAAISEAAGAAEYAPS